jgi:DNA-binding PadR family transcriptional regulator
MSGWDLARTIDGSVGAFWNVTRSQVYRELGTLEDEGLITQVGRTGARDRRVYRLTAAGRRTFKRWVARDLEDETRRVPVVLTTFFGEAVPPKRLAEILDGERADLEAELAELRAQDRSLAGDPHARAAVRFGIAYCRMALRWIDDTRRLAR